MPTQQDFLRKVFDGLTVRRGQMTEPERMFLDGMEHRAMKGPALTSREIAFLKEWRLQLIKRGKDHDDFIARTIKAKAD